MSRRDVLRLTGGTALAVPFASGCAPRSGGGSGRAREAAENTGRVLRSTADLPKPFTVPLPVPKRLEPVRSDRTTDYFEITQQRTTAEILPGLKTEIFGYDGTFPGPTLTSRRGRRTEVRHHNRLPVPTVTHLHGGRTPSRSDGFPTDLVLPDGWTGRTTDDPSADVSHGSRAYTYPIEQPAATLWYHDHRMDFTGAQVYRGLAGFHLVHDDEEDALPLPKGDRDVPLMIADRAFDEDGTFMYPSLDPSLADRPGVEDAYMDGVLGDVVLVNGAPWPELDVTATRYRFRILNASNARRYRLALEPASGEGRAFTQVGSDVGLLDAPIRHDAIEIAPAERFDVVVDFSAYAVGTRVTVVNDFGDGSTGRVMRFHVARRSSDDSAVPSRLADVERLTRSSGTIRRKFSFTRGSHDGHVLWTINGKPFDPTRSDVRPALGSTEIWQITTDVHHPVHIHLGHFQVLRRLTSQQKPGPYDAGWKDTIDMPGGQVAELAVRFTGYRGRYVMHCHNLEHEDMMMMAGLEVV